MHVAYTTGLPEIRRQHNCLRILYYPPNLLRRPIRTLYKLDTIFWMDVSFIIWKRKQIVDKRINICILVFESTKLFIDCFIWYCVACVVYMGWCARVAQWDRSLDLTAHTCLSPIRRGFAPSFVNYKKGALVSQPYVIKFTSCLPGVGGSHRVLQIPPSLKLVAMI